MRWFFWIWVPLGGWAQNPVLDEWSKSLEGMASDEQARWVTARVASSGGTPIITGNEVCFVAEGKGGSVPHLLGHFNDWGGTGWRWENPGEPMQPLAQSGFFYLCKTFEPDARMEYVLQLDDAYFPDPLNPRHVLYLGRKHAYFQMPAYPSAPELEPHAFPRGKLETLDFESATLRNSRKIHIYTPPDLESHNKPLPLLLVGDGSAYVELGRFPHILDYLIGKKLIRPLMAVFIDPVDRWLEYRMHSGHRVMVTQELLPFLAKRYPLSDRPGDRAVLGGSRGGLMAADLALNYPELFSHCALFAPAVHHTDFLHVFANLPRRNVTFFVVVGTYDYFRQGAYGMRPVLEAKGYDHRFLEIPEGHTIYAWRRRLDEILTTFFP